LADRVHNFQTLYTQDEERIERKIKETEEKLIPIVANTDYPNETEYLIARLHESKAYARAELARKNK
jgi:(p)ppGpp synthase/HD superfamily hydrolase